MENSFKFYPVKMIMLPSIMSLFIFLLSCPLILAQKSNIPQIPSGTFDFTRYSFSAKNLYPEIIQEKIKTVRLSAKEIFPSDLSCSFLFNPQEKVGNQTSLMDLLIWAIREKGLSFYDFFSDSVFTNPLPVSDLDKLLKRNISSGDTTIPINLSIPSSYVLLEASIYGFDDKIIAVRPIGLTPVTAYINKNEAGPKVIKYALFQVYFPDIMDMLSMYSPSKKIKGIKTALDLFVKNQYGGTDISKTYFGDFLYWLIDDSDSNQISQPFDTLWLSKRLKSGIYIDPINNKLYGNPGTQSVKKISAPEESNIDFSNILCTRIVQKIINLRDIENYPLYFPEVQKYGNKNLADLIFEGLRNGDYSAFERTDRFEYTEPMTIQQVNDKMQETSILANIGDSGQMTDTLIQTLYNGSDIKQYILKEALFFDKGNRIIGSRLVSLCPLLEKTDNVMGRLIKIPMFEIPFSDKRFKASLAENHVTMFDQGSPESFLSFFLDNKYKVESSDTLPASLTGTIKQLGLQPSLIRDSRGYLYNSTLPDPGEARLVIKEISKSDTINYQLFYPEYSYNGLITFFELLRDAIIKEEVSAWNFDQTYMPREVLTGDSVKNRLHQQVMIIDIETGLERPEHFLFSSGEIEKYLIMEIVTGSLTLPVAICPVRWNQDSESFVKLFWVYFSEPLRNLINQQEVLRLNCEPERTFGEYFVKRKFNGKTELVKPLKQSDVKEIFERLK